MVGDIYIPSIRHGHKGNRLACDAREVVGILPMATGTFSAAGEQTIRGIGQSAVRHPECFGVVRLPLRVHVIWAQHRSGQDQSPSRQNQTHQ